MRFLPLPAVLLLGALAGCDSTTVEPVAEAGPTVQFGTTSVSAAEGTSVTIPVTLSGATGQPVTVEVLYAAGASTATLDEDFLGFGAPDGDLQIATVAFSGAADETVELTIELPEDGAFEDAEEAVFALQQAEGATIGDPRTFTVVIGTLALVDIRARPNLDVVTAEGIVTRSVGRLTYIQDETAGIAIFAFDDTPFGTAVASGAIAPGDLIQVTGKLCEFGAIGFPDDIQPDTGLKQITAPGDQCFSEEPEEGEVEFEVLSRDNALPEPQAVTLAELAESGDEYESELVRVDDLTIDADGDFAFQSSTSYDVTDPTGTLILRVPSSSDTQIVGVPIPTGTFTFEGILGQFQYPDVGNQLTPILASDIIPE